MTAAAVAATRATAAAIASSVLPFNVRHERSGTARPAGRGLGRFVWLGAAGRAIGIGRVSSPADLRVTGPREIAGGSGAAPALAGASGTGDAARPRGARSPR